MIAAVDVTCAFPVAEMALGIQPASVVEETSYRS